MDMIYFDTFLTISINETYNALTGVTIYSVFKIGCYNCMSIHQLSLISPSFTYLLFNFPPLIITTYNSWRKVCFIISIFVSLFGNPIADVNLNFFLQKLDFKFPLSVSCVHFICSAIGAYIMIKVLKLKPLITVDPEDRWRRIFPMSFVFCINIVLGNVSLRYIPVSFMQTIKSFTPATTGQVQVWIT
jgi:uncharacterized membrane protein YeaQ/YmgE (transglycosylase-associated protein family)